MDLLLTHGYFLEEDAHERAVMRPYPPLGILHLSAYLKSRGVDVRVFDTTFSSRGLFEQYLDRERPTVVGIYCNLMTRASVLAQIRLAKSRGATVILGGPEPANYAEEYLLRGADVVVSGEGELTLEALLPLLPAQRRDLFQQVAGIVYRDDAGRLVCTPARPHIQDLDTLPLPDRAAIDMTRYLETWRRCHGLTSVSLATSRGCPYTCAWCSHAVFGHTHRSRGASFVADELEWITQTYHPDRVWYVDDVFTLNHRWLAAYASELKRRNLRVPFEAISREDRLNEETIRTLAEMGCLRLWIGSESGSQPILDAMGRRTNAARVRDMVKLLQKHGIQTGLFIMLGYDGEEIADIQATTEHLRTALPDTFLTTLAYPIKGTPYYARVESRVFSDGPWETGSDRDLTVAGRHSKRFYGFAVRRMQGEVAIARAAQVKPKRLLPLVKAHFNSASGRLGMWCTRRQVEGRTGVIGSERDPSDGTADRCRAAFDQLAGAYDTEFTNLSATRKLRRAVWADMEAVLRAGESVLELGCGTGEDALFLAQRGLRVCACDISPAMVAKAEEKLREKLRPYPGQVEFFSADFRTLAQSLPEERQFDAILSDFGGLNCLPSLSSLHRLVDRNLRPGGHLFLCLINRFYLRELARGVFRRLRASGSPVKCGGQRIAVYYHPPRSFRRPDLRVKGIKALAVFGRDDLHSRWPFNRLGDHYLIVLQKDGTDTDGHGLTRTAGPSCTVTDADGHQVPR